MDILSDEEYEKIKAGDIDWMLDDGRGVVAELYAKMKGDALRPKTLVEYTRYPFIYDAGNVRVTIDRDIRTGITSTDLFDPSPLVPTFGTDVLEVKYDKRSKKIRYEGSGFEEIIKFKYF